MKKSGRKTLLCAVAAANLFLFQAGAAEKRSYVIDPSSSGGTDGSAAYAAEKVIVLERDVIRLELDSSTGSFMLYALPERGRAVPLLSSYDSGSASFFALRAGRKEYRLARGTGIKTEARRTPLGAQMAYLIPSVAQVVVDFSFFPSVPNSTRTDMLRVTVYTINLGKTMQAFALKGVFDTVLGENTSAHFSTAARSKINSEMQFMSMADELWIRSGNSKASVQFLLEGTGITRPAAVFLAVKDSLENSSGWIPSVQMEKSFTSVLSYNNSAVGINWNTMYLEPLKTDAAGFFISVAADGEMPAGKKFLSDLENGRAMPGAFSKAAAVMTDSAPPPVPLTPEEAGVQEESAAQAPLVEVTDSQLDPEYIQDLLDHIASLTEESGVSSEELKRLNSELDAILAALEADR